MSKKSDWDLTQKVDDIFKNVVEPSLEELIQEYDGVGGYQVKIVPDGPLITGIQRYMSILFKLPNGIEMVICVYWVSGSERLVVENIQMVTLNKRFDIFSVTREELREQIKYLAGIGSKYP